MNSAGWAPWLCSPEPNDGVIGLALRPDEADLLLSLLEKGLTSKFLPEGSTERANAERLAVLIKQLQQEIKC